MGKFYTAYIKPINGVNFYFVKHFETFPEYKSLPPLLKNYGMHTNFRKACRIALINDKTTEKQLFETIKSTAGDAKIIHMDTGKTNIFNYRSLADKFTRLIKNIS